MVFTTYESQEWAIASLKQVLALQLHQGTLQPILLLAGDLRALHHM
jgi:hypothetical protein